MSRALDFSHAQAAVERNGESTFYATGNQHACSPNWQFRELHDVPSCILTKS